MVPGVNLFAIDNCDGQVAFGTTENALEITEGLETTRTWAAIDDCGNVNLAVRYDTCTVAAVQLKAILAGTMIGATPGSSNLMRDDLRSLELIPLEEPYTALTGFEHKGKGGREHVLPSVLTGNSAADAVVDWMFVEIRDELQPSEVLATKSVLLQRDGDITTVDGRPVVTFPTQPEGEYYVVLRHRNHLGMSSSQPLFLSTAAPPLVDFTGINTDVLGGIAAGKQHASGRRTLWAGDLNGDGRVIYQGPNNDVFKLFSDVLSDEGNVDNLANFILPGYKRTDVNLDGKSIYQGPNNDRSMLIIQTILSHPVNTALLANYIANEFLP